MPLSQWYIKVTELPSICKFFMLGMMDTVLNLGLNDKVVGGLASKSGERFANDSYKRFLGMVVDVVTCKCFF